MTTLTTLRIETLPLDPSADYPVDTTMNQIISMKNSWLAVGHEDARTAIRDQILAYFDTTPLFNNDRDDLLNWLGMEAPSTEPVTLSDWYDHIAEWEINECDDGDATLSAFRLMGELSASIQLMNRGVPLPKTWTDDLIAEVKALTNYNREE